MPSSPRSAAQLVDVGGLTVVVQHPVAARRVAGRPPVVLVHGMMGGAWYWASWQRAFADAGWSTWAVNLRGHHGSRPVRDLGAVSVREYVQDALDVIAAASAAHEGQHPVIIGHSMGGFIAQRVAATAGAVAGAVIVCGAPPRGIPVLSWALARRQFRFVLPILFRGSLVMTRADADALNFNRVPEADRSALFARMVPESGRVGLELSIGQPVNAADVQVPMLVVAAEDDQFIPARIAGRIAARYGAELAVFPEHGHFIMCEPGWETPAHHVTAWLAETVGSGEMPGLARQTPPSVSAPAPAR